MNAFFSARNRKNARSNHLMRYTAASGVAVALLVFSGCSSTPQDTEDTATEVSEDTVVTEEEETVVEESTPVAEVDLPEDFPSEVPLPNLPLIEVADMPPELKTWDLMFASADPQADFLAAVDQLESAGFTHVIESDEGEATGAMMDNGTYLLTISQDKDFDGNSVLRYIVKENDA